MARRIFAVAYPGHQVVGLAQPVARSDLRQVFVFDLLQRNSIFPRFLLDQLAPDFNGPLALMNVEPVLDFVTGARRLDQAQPVAARLMSRLRENLDDVSRVEFVAERHHAPVHLGADARVPDFRVNRIREINRGRIARQHHHLALRREGVDLFRIQIDFQRR